MGSWAMVGSLFLEVPPIENFKIFESIFCLTKFRVKHISATFNTQSNALGNFLYYGYLGRPPPSDKDLTLFLKEGGGGAHFLVKLLQESTNK